MVNPLHTHRPHAIEYVLRKVDLHHIHMKSGTANRSAHAVLFVVIRPVCVFVCARGRLACGHLFSPYKYAQIWKSGTEYERGQQQQLQQQQFNRQITCDFVVLETMQTMRRRHSDLLDHKAWRTKMAEKYALLMTACQGDFLCVCL